jgi:AcrR family transcriptional regulator
MQTATTQGLRERKKRRTRARIAQVAMELFKSRGFDAVTVADVAQAAEVSEKTVFNYFPSKEDLVLEDVVEHRAAFIDAVRNRASDASLVDPFRQATLELLDRVAHDSIESIVAVPRLVRQSRALQDKLFSTWEQEAAWLAPVIAAETGHDADQLAPSVVARTLAWTHRLVYRAAVSRLLSGESQVQVAEDLRRQAHEAYDLLERGFGGFGAK